LHNGKNFVRKPGGPEGIGQLIREQRLVHKGLDITLGQLLHFVFLWPLINLDANGCRPLGLEINMVFAIAQMPVL
jgi:hypothetical protein